MPALYAHNRFGGEVVKHLDDELSSIIQKHYTQFRIGLQGPDIFFFYKPWKKTHVSLRGYGMHDEYADTFFEKAAEVVRNTGRNSREYAYILGFICHFALDSECHPYVEKMVKEKGVSHIEIEGEFEKHLLRLDGRDPLAYPISKFVPTDDATVDSIYHFFSDIKRNEIKEALETLKFIKSFLTAPKKSKQNIINAALKLTGLDKSYHGLMHSYYDNPKCQETNKSLEGRLNQAVLTATMLIRSYDETVQKGVLINERFHRTFD